MKNRCSVSLLIMCFNDHAVADFVDPLSIHKTCFAGRVRYVLLLEIVLTYDQSERVRCLVNSQLAFIGYSQDLLTKTPSPAAMGHYVATDKNRFAIYYIYRQKGADETLKSKALVTPKE